jgi:hypothetical protein
LEAGGRGDKGGRREEIEGRRSAGCGLSEEIRTVAGAAAKGRLRSGGGGRAQRRRARAGGGGSGEERRGAKPTALIPC